MSIREVDWKALLRSVPSGARVLEIGKALARAGATPVLVGGAVRDGLIDVPVKDLDVDHCACDPSTCAPCVKSGA